MCWDDVLKSKDCFLETGKYAGCEGALCSWMWIQMYANTMYVNTNVQHCEGTVSVELRYVS